MQRTRSFVLALLLLCFAGCGQGQDAQVGSETGEGLLAAPGVTVSIATYTLSGPKGFTSAGTISVSESADVSAALSHLPVGQGYLLAVSGTGSDGVTVCDGTKTFDVTDGNATSVVVVHLECGVPQGQISVEAPINLCPTLDELTASPVNLRLGGVANLAAVGHDADSAPAPLGYSWTVNGLKLAGRTQPTLNFGCTSLGQVMIGAVVSDGDPTCNDSATVTVSCE